MTLLTTNQVGAVNTTDYKPGGGAVNTPDYKPGGGVVDTLTTNQVGSVNTTDYKPGGGAVLPASAAPAVAALESSPNLPLPMCISFWYRKWCWGAAWVVSDLTT